MDEQAMQIRRLTALLDVSQALGSTLDLREALEKALEILDRELGMRQGAIALLNEKAGESGELSIKYAHGMSEKEIQRGKYRLDEGITGRVVTTGKPVIVPQISKEPLFLNRTKRTGGGQEDSFICVPIKDRRKTIGALSILFPYKQNRSYDDSVKLLTIIASMIAQSLRLAQMVEQEKAQLTEENTLLKRELQQKYDFRNIVGTSKEMRDVYEQVAQVAHSNTTVLIRGESGTGKELVAHAIHYNSPRSAKPFVKVNCAALPESLIEAELFGHEKGAFTGAIQRKRGRFELAEGGTLFLDEIGDLSPAMQVKLLRVLQEREFERVGGMETIKVNVRVITATNVDLEAAVQDGKFRSDLYYRLNVFSIYLPPLRERKTDVLLLADHFLEKYGRQNGKSIKRISTPAIDMLNSYHWPGNVRELENVIERATLVSDGNVIHGYHLPPTLQTAEGSDTGTRLGLDQAVGAFEKEMIQDVLKTARGNRARAARMLDTTERILGYKVKKYGIDCKRFRG
ncbi:MAG: nif-specific transcriptional activator NifA [Acidobacteria bacterium]|nr:nif-specific transcriptional activator NifA [Acidobacteriota bacterium]MBI3425793.1 nif-specific transcriptional activator NifA [Acidobacteriota bacterium]